MNGSAVMRTTPERTRMVLGRDVCLENQKSELLCWESGNHQALACPVLSCPGLGISLVLAACSTDLWPAQGLITFVFSLNPIPHAWDLAQGSQNKLGSALVMLTVYERDHIP